MFMSELDPHLAACRVTIRHSSGTDLPPATLPADCLNAAKKFRLPPLYEFELEKRILKQASDNERQRTNAPDLVESLKKSILSQMMSITNAGEDRCRVVLDKHNYDLTRSVEAYYATM